MKILTDTHTHTDSSDHAYGTVLENLMLAKKKGLKMICITNHGPQMPDAPHEWHFHCLKELPDEFDGVRLIKGAEANILDVEGNLDIPVNIQQELDMMIASIHGPCYDVKTTEEHTKTWLNVIANPYVTVLGHIGRHREYTFDCEAVVEAVRTNHKCIEINNHSFMVGNNGGAVCREIAQLCKKMGAYIVVSSDAHSPFGVGVLDNSIKMLEEIDFPERLIMNLTAERFEEYLRKYRN